ncbi:MAG: rRNA adenine N-6-methyltransferase family protein [Natrialbaceae archaeon]|nr:rRNA adenine N-6-methyltransferase family protein [Natrialbaceae archaeon]
MSKSLRRSRQAFDPQPAVESAAVRTVPRAPSYSVDDDDDAFFLQFVKALFTQRRKTVRNAIRNSAHISELGAPAAVVEAADEALLQKRPDALEPAEFAELASLALAVGAPSDQSA